MSFSVSGYGALVDPGESSLSRGCCWKPHMFSLFESGVVDLVKNLRQDARLLLEKISNLDDEPVALEARCLKNCGRVGRQPTVGNQPIPGLL